MKRTLLFSLFAIVLSSFSWAQQDVTGDSTDARDNSPLAGVSVFVRGRGREPRLVRDGRFRISAPDNATLVFSFTGFAEKEVQARGNSVNVTLTWPRRTCRR